MPTATKNWTAEELDQVAAELEPQGPEATLEWMVDQFHPSLYVACSFQQEESVLLDMLHRIEPEIRIFYLDTDVLFKETYETRDRFAERYGFEFERYHNITLEEQAKLHGDELWKSAPDQCCAIRKVEPLKRALGSVDAWITGVRRDQAPTRANSQEGRVGRQVRPREGEPARGLDARGRVGLHPRARRPLQPAARPELPVDRLHPLHPPGDARRGPARGPLGRPGQGRVRPAPGRGQVAAAPAR